MSTVYNMTEAAGGGSATATGNGWGWHPDANGAAILDWCRAHPEAHAATSEYNEDITGAELLARVGRLGARQATDADAAGALRAYGWLPALDSIPHFVDNRGTVRHAAEGHAAPIAIDLSAFDSLTFDDPAKDGPE